MPLCRTEECIASMKVLFLFGFALPCLLMVSLVRFLFLEKHILLV